MAAKNKSASPQKRLNILIIRPKGEANSFSLSPVVMVISLAFIAIFTVVAIVVMKLYFSLYLDHQDLLISHQGNSRELIRLQSLYAYQSAVAVDFANLMNTINRPEPGPASDPKQAGALDEPLTPSLSQPDQDNLVDSKIQTVEMEINTLEEWANLFPDPPQLPEQSINASQLRTNGAKFKFRLTNEEARTMAQGHILLLFAVQTTEGVVLTPYPEFDLKSTAPDFNQGPSYNIRSSKLITGQLKLPTEGKVLEMMIIAKAQSGVVMLKKKLTPRP